MASALPIAAAEAHKAAEAAALPATGPLDIKLPPLEAPTDPKGAEPFNPDAPARRVGYAISGAWATSRSMRFCLRLASASMPKP